jgi:hypothetical protein
MSRTPFNKKMNANHRALLPLAAREKFGRAVRGPQAISAAVDHFWMFSFPANEST